MITLRHVSKKLSFYRTECAARVVRRILRMPTKAFDIINVCVRISSIHRIHVKRLIYIYHAILLCVSHVVSEMTRYGFRTERKKLFAFLIASTLTYVLLASNCQRLTVHVCKHEHKLLNCIYFVKHCHCSQMAHKTNSDLIRTRLHSLKLFVELTIYYLNSYIPTYSPGALRILRFLL